MPHNEEMNKRLNEVRKKMGISLVISWLIPWILYMVLRMFFANDATALAITGVIPVVRTIVIGVWRRKVDWIGVLGVLSFAVALAATALSGGSSLPLKLYHPVITGTIGLAFLISWAIRKPLLLTLIRMLKHGDPEQLSNPQSHTKFTIINAVVGLVFVIDAVAHIFMAFTLSTVTFLAMSKVVTIICIIALVLGRMWIARRGK